MVAHRYHGDNASVSAISGQLRDVCPSLYRAEDAQLSKASQLILDAKACKDPARKEAAFREAVAVSSMILILWRQELTI